MSAKIASLVPLKIKVFLIKDYGVIIFVYELINKNVSRDSNHTVVVVMWPNFGNSRNSMREVIITLRL